MNVADDRIEAGQPESGSELEEGNLPPENVEHDELDDELPPEAGQPAEGTSDPSPEAGQVEGQEPAPAGEPPQHPDNVDIEAMNEEQYGAWAQENPGAARRMALRDRDYREKTERLARDREQLEADQRQFRESVVQGTEANEPTPAAPAETPASVPGPVATSALLTQADEYWQELRQQLGRDPLQVELDLYMAQQVVGESVGPVQEQQAVRDQQDALDRFTEQMAELQQKYPEATAPGTDVELAKELDRIGSDVAKGDVEKVFLSLKGPELLEKARAGKTQAREQQRERAQQQPAVPPAAGPGEAGLAETSDLDEIARRQKARMRSGA